MKRSTSWIASAFVLALFVAGAGQAQAAEDTTSLKGNPAPEVALTTLDGKEVKLSDQKGKVVLMDFWATWCPPCVKGLPHINELANDAERAKKGLVVWAVNAREEGGHVKKWLDDRKLTLTVPMDKGESLKAYLIRGIPTTVVVGRDGKVREVFIGFGDGTGAKIDAAVDAALAEEAKEAAAAAE